MKQIPSTNHNSFVIPFGPFIWYNVKNNKAKSDVSNSKLFENHTDVD